MKKICISNNNFIKRWLNYVKLRGMKPIKVYISIPSYDLYYFDFFVVQVTELINHDLCY